MMIFLIVMAVIVVGLMLLVMGGLIAAMLTDSLNK